MTEQFDRPTPGRRYTQTMRALVVGWLVVGFACADDGTGTGGRPDSGADFDGGAPDAAVFPDAAACLPSDEPAPFPCNPVDGTRCEVSTGTRCVLEPQLDEGRCVCLEGSKGFRESCADGEPECQPGFACFGLVGQGGPTCQKICDFESGRGCEEVDETGIEAYECGGLDDGTGMAATHGICFFVGEACDLLINDCPPSQTCTVTGLQSACVDVGNQAEGEDCSLDARCQRDLVCWRGRLDLRPNCKPVCDPDLPEDPCGIGRRCRPFQDLSGGICD